LTRPVVRIRLDRQVAGVEIRFEEQDGADAADDVRYLANFVRAEPPPEQIAASSARTSPSVTLATGCNGSSSAATCSPSRTDASSSSEEFGSGIRGQSWRSVTAFSSWLGQTGRWATGDRYGVNLFPDRVI